MKYFLMILGLVIFFPATSQKVCLTPETARWYVEQADRAEILAIKDTLNQLLIANKEFQLAKKDSVINSYKRGEATYEEMLDIQRTRLKTKEEHNSYLRKEVRRQKLQKTLVAIGSGVLIILILI